MNGERLLKIIIMDLTTDSLKLEQELERIINSDLETDYKTQTIKTILSRIVSVEASITKLTTLMNNNNNDLKQNENE